MPEVEAPVAAEPTAESNSYLDRLPESVRDQFSEVLDGAPTLPDTEAPEAEPVETGMPRGEVVTTESLESLPVSTQDAEGAQRAPTDEEIITRRNAPELVAQARAERDRIAAEFEALKQEVAQRDQTTAQASTQIQRFSEVSREVASELNQREALKDAIASGDRDTLGSFPWVDAYGERRQGFSYIEDAQDYLKRLNRDMERGDAIAGIFFNHVTKTTEGKFAEIAQKHGIDPKSLGGDVLAALETLATGIAANKDTEWKGKYDALKADYDALKGQTGPRTAPESGGRSASSGRTFTRAEIARMTPDEYLRHKKDIWAQI